VPEEEEEWLAPPRRNDEMSSGFSHKVGAVDERVELVSDVGRGGREG